MDAPFHYYAKWYDTADTVNPRISSLGGYLFLDFSMGARLKRRLIR